ncbi:MAG: hypothetical protein AAF468_18520 [Pseudomonadota bacterium]
MHPMSHIKSCGYTPLDTQFTTAHLMSFGAIDILSADYEVLLADALEIVARAGFLGDGD